jgi:hypothetical protein
MASCDPIACGNPSDTTGKRIAADCTRGIRNQAETKSPLLSMYLAENCKEQQQRITGNATKIYKKKINNRQIKKNSAGCCIARA